MSRQIRIAQSEVDEEDIRREVFSLEEMSCLPRLMSADDVRRGPQPLGVCGAQDQILFLTALQSQVLSSVAPLLGNDSVFHVSLAEDLYIEWSRTLRGPGGECQAGRYYFSPDKKTSAESAARLGKVMSRLMSCIRSDYPRRTAGRFPIFVGPHLLQLMDSGRARLVYPDGMPVDLMATAGH